MVVYSFTLCNNSSISTRSIKPIFSVPVQQHISKLLRYFWSNLRRVQVSAPYKARLQMYHFSTIQRYAPNVPFQHHTKLCSKCTISAPYKATLQMYHFSTIQSYAPNVPFHEFPPQTEVKSAGKSSLFPAECRFCPKK